MTKSSDAELRSGGKGLSMSISAPSKVAFIAVFSLVVVVAYWRTFAVQRGAATVLSTLSLTLNPSSPTASTPPKQGPLLQPAVTKLVEAIRREVLKVERNTGSSPNTDFDLAKWREENPCTSRTELATYYGRLLDSPNRKGLGIAESRQWETVLYEYERLHRVCIRAAGNLTEYFYARNSTTGCKFMVAESKNGLGNKLFIMAPSLLYAILTQRVILIPQSTGVPDLMCEPFPGSTWRLSSEIQNTDVPIWNQTREFLDNVDRAKREHESTLPMYASRIDNEWLPDGRCVLIPYPTSRAG